MIIRKSSHKPSQLESDKCQCGGDIEQLKKCRYPVGHYETVIVPGGEGCKLAGFPFILNNIYDTWVSTSNDIWADMWSESIPPKSEFCQVIQDVSYDRMSKEELAYYNKMSEKAKNKIIADVM